MIYYPIATLVNSGITDIVLVCGGNSVGQFLELLGNGRDLGVEHLHYTYQRKPAGIADALGLAESLVGDEKMCVILSDNIFQDTFRKEVEDFDQPQHKGAIIFGTYVKNPEHYGVIVTDSNDNIVCIEEKPKNPTSNLIATGLYMYDNTVWNFIRQMSPSERGELEITDVNNHYLKKNQLAVKRLNGFWKDCGEDFDSYLDAGLTVRELGVG